MLRLVFSLLCVSAAIGQTAKVNPNTLLIAGDDSKWLVHFTTQEKCYECGYRYAVGCLPGTADCGVPDKTVDHYEMFATQKEAVAFLNRGMVSGTGTTFTVGGTAFWVSGDPMIGNSSPAITLSPRKFIALYRIVPVSVEQSTKRTEQPSPPKVTEIITYSVK